MLRVGQSPKLAYAGAKSVGLQQATCSILIELYRAERLHAYARDDLQLPRPMSSKYADDESEKITSAHRFARDMISASTSGDRHRTSGMLVDNESDAGIVVHSYREG